ncbi:MAG: T9SS type A sorting domain-containing protein, partial [Bacteroidia bacterium]|nr:T9SS type A sorting domain-containing protein [Bacteroidia bacterium]
SLNNDGFLGSVNISDSADPVYQSGCICGATITAGGAVSFCTGGSVVLSANAGAGFTYQWRLNSNNISGATSQTYTASAGGNYTCIVTNICGSNTSNTITVTLYTTTPSATIIAGGPTTFCSNSNVWLSANTGVDYSWQWQKNTVNISGAVSAIYSSNTTGSYRCIVTNPCGNSTSNAISVTVNTQPTAAINPAGTVNICTGQTVQLSASSGTGYVYQWKKNGANVSGATSQSYSAAQAASYTVMITLGSCTATSSPTTVTVNQMLTPTVTNAGFGGFCGSTTVQLQTNYYNAGYLYSWFEDTHPIPNSNNYQLEVGHNGNYSVQINNGCGIFSSAPYTLTDFNNPWLEPYITITNSGSLNLCGGGSVNLFINSNNFYQSPSFQWYRDGAPIGGATGTSYNATTGGNYFCSVTDFLWCGWQGPLVYSNWLVATSSPSASIIPQGSTAICNGSSVILAANTGGGFAYQWKNNGTNISGATNQNYAATSNGSYTVVVTNTCGTAASAAVIVTVNPLPSATITPAGSTTFCANESVVLNAPTAANRTYQWLKGGNNISGATQSSYTATSGGTYKVSVTNPVTGCSKTTSTGILVTVNAQPNATITPQGPTTFCAGGSVVLKANSGAGLTYKWKKGGAFISGVTSLNYTATTAGTYKVQVKNSNGCTKTSPGVVVTVPCREDGSLVNVFDVNVYPNPSSGDFVFNFENTNEAKILISVFDAIGKLILTEESSDKQFTIHSSQLSPGVYSAVIVNGENKRVLKLVKTE